MMDRIFLEGVQVMANIGISEEERARLQKLEISIVMSLDVSEAARTQRLSLSVDYAEAHKKVIEVVQKYPRILIETLAEDLAEILLRTFKISSVEVSVRKFVLEETRSAGVTILRSAQGRLS